jgi:hypothetical protein
MKRRFLLSLITGVLWAGFNVQATVSEEPTPETVVREPQVQPVIPSLNAPPALPPPPRRPNPAEQSPIAWDMSDPDIRDAHKAWAIAYMKRETEKYAEHKNAFAGSGSMSVAVFWAAQGLLLWAVVAASVEFIRAQKVRTAAGEMQELRVSLEGLALKTSMHGTLLLVIAMSFYYLFLKFVYPVTVVGV